MLPQSHIIISEHIYSSVKETLGVELNKGSLFYGSIKPDLIPRWFRIEHFKPQSFNYICDEIHKLSNFRFDNNKNFVKIISRQIGVVSHYISDYFCLPHNDRSTYENRLLNHVVYEFDLHSQYKEFDKKIGISKDLFNIDNISANNIKKLIDQYHREYTLEGKSLLNDLESSITASSIVALYIVHHALSSGKQIIAA